MTIRLLLADDHPVVRTGLRGMLASQTDFEVVGEASTGIEAIRLAEQLHPDVILMDLHMPELDGATAITQIRANVPGTRVLVLTTYDTDTDILRSVQAGATGYLLKDVPREELFRAIYATARDEAALSPAVATWLMRQQTQQAPAPEMLSEREHEVLTLVARGLSNKEIAQQLHISQATIKTHLLHIFGKLGVADRTAAVTVAIERRYLSVGKPPE